MLYTIGHSNHDKEQFVALLDSVEEAINSPIVVIDTRSHPTSSQPHWRHVYLRRWLNKRYQWWPHLGGWTARHDELSSVLRHFLVDRAGVDLDAYASGAFPKQRVAAARDLSDSADRNGDGDRGSGPTWTNQGLYDYSWYTALPEFLGAADKLLELSQTQNLAIMCCECQWWRCHRSMIADHVVWRGGEAIHLMPRYRQRNKVKFVDGTRQTPHSTVISDRLQRYDRRILLAWHMWHHGGKREFGGANNET